MSTKTTPEQLTEAGIRRARGSGRRSATSTLEIAGQSFSIRGEADAIAQATLDQLANAYLAAEGACHGNPDIKAGVKLKITGVGTKLLRHLPGREGRARAAAAAATSRSSPTRPASTRSLGQAARNGHVPGRIDSIVVGVVTNNNDPDKLGRVKVKLPFAERAGDVLGAGAAGLAPARSAGSRCCPSPTSR